MYMYICICMYMYIYTKLINNKSNRARSLHVTQVLLLQTLNIEQVTETVQLPLATL